MSSIQWCFEVRVIIVPVFEISYNWEMGPACSGVPNSESKRTEVGLQSSAVGLLSLGLISCSPATSCLSSISLECGSPGARDLRKDTSAFLTEEREVRPLLPRHLLFLSLIIWKFLDLVTPLTLLLQLSCQWGSFGPQDSLW